MKTITMALGAVTLLAGAAPCLAQDIAAPGVQLAVMTPPELDRARGGFVVGGNLAFEFGATMKTFENGALALQTNVNWTTLGAQISQSVGAGVTALTQDAAAKALGAIQVGGQASTSSAAPAVATTVASAPAAQAALATATPVAASAVPTAFQTADGATLIQAATAGQLANVVANTASNQTFVQQTNVTLTLPGFAATQSGIASTLMGIRLGDEVNIGAVRSVGR